MCGTGELDLPDDIDPKDMDAVKAFISDHWDEVPLPKPNNVEYVDGSCQFDPEAWVRVLTDEPQMFTDVDAETPMSLQNRWLRVDWYNAGEGFCGDYDPDNPEDVNLLRFDVYLRKDVEWEPVEDASYCTQMPSNEKPEILSRSLKVIFKQYEDALRSDPETPVKKLGEALSWISPSDFREEEQ